MQATPRQAKRALEGAVNCAEGVASIYASLGEKDKAFEWLEKAYLDRSLAIGVSLKTYPAFDSLRSDPRFNDLVRRMNFQKESL